MDHDFTTQLLVNVIEKGKSIVHISTHGEESSIEDGSYILLGDGEKLLLSKLQKINFSHINLVVISVGGTGILSDSRETFVSTIYLNGANNVISPVWLISDDATSLFMQNLYKNLAEGFSIPEAMRRTQLRFLGDEEYKYYRHPYFWAPFILLGNG